MKAETAGAMLLGAALGFLAGGFLGAHSAFRNACHQAHAELVDTADVYACMPHDKAAKLRDLAGQIEGLKK